MRRLSIVIIGLALFGATARGQDYRVVFEGRPLKQVWTAFDTVTARTLNTDESFTAAVRIVERNGKYYWASREMVELLRHEAGAYITFMAINGTGYVRVGIPLMLDLRDQLPADQRKKEIGYTEHLLTRFAAITYYGNRVGTGRGASPQR